MLIKCDLEELLKTGVYIIRNIKNNKFYVGGASKSLQRRFNEHVKALKKGNHKNSYLQNSWNKYNETDWEISILEVCDKELVFIREQYWIDTLDAKNKGYNINPLATGNPLWDKETRDKRNKTFKETSKIASDYFYKVQSNEVSINDVPVKYHKMINNWLNNVPWNKGKIYDNTDHLKVPKKVKGDRTKANAKLRSRLPKVYVYDLKLNFIQSWETAKDLEKDSNDISFFLANHMTLRNPRGRNGYLPHELKSFNINKSNKNDTPYKGLYFKFSPL